MIRLFYEILVHIIFVVLLPYLLLNAGTKGKLGPRLKERFGFLPKSLRKNLHGQRPIWIHAVSVGEVQMLAPLLETLSRENPNTPVVISTNTVTGQKIAATYSTAGTFYVPLDFCWAVSRVLRQLNPCLVIVMETELWPNLIRQPSRRGIPVVYLNGRISDKSYGWYRFSSPLLGHFLKDVTAWGMRSSLDAERITQIGADPARVTITGNLKYDSALALLETPSKISRESLGISSEDRLLIAGSTFAGEEQALAEVWKTLRQKHSNLRLLIVPRHPERVSGLVQQLSGAGFEVVRRSNEGDLSNPSRILLWDTIGELKFLYGLSDIVFMGKSLGISPKGKGGQNPLEPAVWGKPIITGPFTENFTDIYSTLEENNAVVVVKNQQHIQSAIDDLLDNSSQSLQIGANAHKVVAQSREARKHCLDLVKKYLPKEI